MKAIAGFVVGVLATTGFVLVLNYCPTEDSCAFGYSHHIGYTRKVTP